MANLSVIKSSRTLIADPSTPVAVRLAAIDVGSNSLHLIVAQADSDGSITTLWRMKEMVGLGRISFPSHRLSAEAIDRAIITLHRFQQTAQRRQCEKVVAVATSAVREAENGGDFIERVRHETGLNIRVVSAREEARLIYLGVRHGIDMKGGPHLILDVGGGSVEFVVADESRPLLLESRKLGAARMTAQYVNSDPINSRDFKSLLHHYDQELTPLCKTIKALGPVRFIGTSGTLESIAAMCGATEKFNGDGRLPVIRRDDFQTLFDKLIRSNASRRAKIPRLDEKRQDQIVAGALLINELFQRLDMKKIVLCRSALREGILVDYLSRHLPEIAIRRQVPDPRRRSVMDLARRCDWHETHSLHVASLAMQLFDQLKPLHKLDAKARELIEYGALLHDIGWHISASSHHKHSMYLIFHGDLKDFEPEEIRIIGNIARYHRRSKPKSTHESFATLTPRAQRIVQIGGALLRISDGLDRSHCGVVTRLKCDVRRRRVLIKLYGRGDNQLELWAARQKTDLFVDVFKRTVAFESIKEKQKSH